MLLEQRLVLEHQEDERDERVPDRRGGAQLGGAERRREHEQQQRRHDRGERGLGPERERVGGRGDDGGEHHAEQQDAVGDRHRRATGAEHVPSVGQAMGERLDRARARDAVRRARRRDHEREIDDDERDRDDGEGEPGPAPSSRVPADEVGEQRRSDDRQREGAVREHASEPERRGDRERGEGARRVQRNG